MGCEPGQITVGAAAADITPDLGVPLAGYRARTGVSDSCHDRLEATAFAFADASSSAVIVSIDVLAVDAAFVKEIRDRAAAAHGLDPDSVLVAATHTHSGPPIASISGAEPNEQAREIALQGAIAAIHRAWVTRLPGSIRLGWSTVEGVGLNRHDPRRPRADEITALSLESSDAVLGTLYAYACHPTVLDYRNLSISADLPGVVRSRLRASHDNLPVGFLNGAAGDISTRFSRRASSFSELERLGEAIFVGLVTSLDSAERLEAAPISFTRRAVTLATKVGNTASETEEKLAAAQAAAESLRAQGASASEIRRADVDIEGLLEDLERQKHYLPEVPTEVQAIRLGDLTILSAPGELFSGTGKALAADGNGATVLVVGYANDYIGYIPDRAAYEHDCYEISIAQVDERAVDQIEAASRAALATLSG